MSINADLDHLLHQLPELLSWILPGLLLIFSYRRLKYEDRNDEKDSISVLKAIGISLFIRYAVIIILSCLPGDWLFGLDGDVWIAICSCLAAILLGGLLGWASNLPITKNFSEKYLNFTIDSNPFFDLPDKKDGCYARVFLKQDKEEYIFGVYSNCYNRGTEDWIVIMNALRIKGNPDKNIEYQYALDQLTKEKESKLLINAKEVELIEYIYKVG